MGFYWSLCIAPTINEEPSSPERHSTHVDNIGIIGPDPGFVGSTQVELVSRNNAAGLRAQEVERDPWRHTWTCLSDTARSSHLYNVLLWRPSTMSTVSSVRVTTIARNCGPQCAGSSTFSVVSCLSYIQTGALHFLHGTRKRCE